MDAKKILFGVSVLGVLAGLYFLIKKVSGLSEEKEKRAAILEKAREAKAIKAVEKNLPDQGEISNQD